MPCRAHVLAGRMSILHNQHCEGPWCCPASAHSGRAPGKRTQTPQGGEVSARLVTHCSMPCRAHVLADRISTLLEKRARLAAEAEVLQDRPDSKQRDEDEVDVGMGPVLDSLPSEPELSPLPKPAAPARFGPRLVKAWLKRVPPSSADWSPFSSSCSFTRGRARIPSGGAWPSSCRHRAAQCQQP